ncbi:50S ribosomal protein L10 [Deinococcus radiodurans]|uniref:Large ribosomal subunit protein uL10 n=1 Tax=Deinococcus radiodurans (strain ATCC 13939 / DSM 20539 / JCM 16871 / CCUG 27074 / LMG 4051 / NBRC 15346 / NCIMB 9279 / VKM B-1422 / R1) TaxID=243230 RepID=RL10_DEIRA|nr:50S ribosomal protein L10 [Deinococcus radiodurans]Q9RSS9.1 RecName: Full=Large ribosomal subunit protein uL10; AltName: Full=50S ribosomal protein L10 [Deinococcus radiodurans R1 = ATCC 13939 = DSM 20539]MCQ7564599.1 50S ribosomal protein L10 [Salmonella enterica]AAF11591.1 ribosomal protein L10 [Deinococcus radiodurans R1 = ATCC 13939 = DSM 20539]ANC70883.1 50S ribosomal protein L10 [Deinococcus radiodurans R1 = ATCC 13939 = DSM 20539]MCQ7805807.1 50S ribosomal protein L10 [Salmonella ent
MANEKNQQTLGSLKDSLQGIETFYVVDYQGLTAGQLTQLRKDIREKGGQLIVAKNTLLNLALQEGGRDFDDALKGPSALVLAQEDPAGVAKALSDAAGRNDRGIPTVKGGFVEGSKVDVAVVQRLASLGSKTTLQAELVGVLSAHLSNFVGILEAYREKLEGEGGSESA